MSKKWLWKKLNEPDEDGESAKEKIARHLIEVATKWQIMHFGKEIEVASGRDSVEAAKLLYGYVLGSPMKTPNQLDVAEHFRSVAHDQFLVLEKVLGDRLKTMTPAELGDMMSRANQNIGRFMEEAARVAAEEPEEPQPAQLPATSPDGEKDGEG